MNFNTDSGKLSKVFFHIVFAFVAFVIFSLFAPQCQIKHRGEPYSGRSFYKTFNEGWTLIHEDGSSRVISLPEVENVKKGELIVLERKLPETIQDHLSLFTRTSRQNMRIYVDGNLRAEYTTDNLLLFSKDVPSAYLFIDLTSSDAGRTVRIEEWGTSKFRNQLQQVVIAHASSAWNYLWQHYGIIVFVNVLLLFCGFFSAVICMILSIITKNATKLIRLSYSLILFSLWALSESRLRQIIFRNSTVPGVLVFLLMPLMVIPLYSYWNSVQKKRYTVYYNIVNGLLLGVSFLMTILYMCKVSDFFDFVLLNYALIGTGIIVSFVTTFIDLVKHRLWEYRYSALGMLAVLIAGAMELLLSRLRPFYAAGFYLSVSLILMLALSAVQGIRDLIDQYRNRERHMGEMTLRTIRTVAGTIDAKDEYTGGHSSRVAEYAVRLARALGKNEEECRNIHYIGLMHDIGKIGVPDVILNKNGKLVQDEYSLMRLHTTIGCEIIGDIDTVPGLREGVLYHHEWYNGKGYPMGLKGDAIPEIARILCLADSYDAMTSNRVYRKRLSDDEVRKEIERCAGSQFDPEMAKIFISLMDSGKIRPETNDGFENSYDEGKSLSLALQKLIQKNNSYTGAYEMTNPEFMRMIVYIIKLAERNRQSLMVKLFSVKGRNGEELAGTDAQEASELLRRSISETIRSTDITTPYSLVKRLVLFMNMNPDNSEHVISCILEKFKSLDLEGNFGVSLEDIELK
ncbi:MAG: HD-GYP domain-containing protein [Treponema sp.]|nr:HD-GYP domain-containing protein [Treponema sp.]